MNSIRQRAILVGSGGHATSILQICIQNFTLEGYLSPESSIYFNSKNITYLGTDSFFDEQANIAKYFAILGVGFTKNSQLRLDVYESLKAKGVEFRGFIANQATIDPSALIHSSTQVLPNAYIGPNTQINENTLVNTSAVIEHDVEIGRYVHVGPGAVLCGGVLIGDNVQIGANSTLLPGIKIGSNAVIGAGSVVTKNISADLIAYGNPAQGH